MMNFKDSQPGRKIGSMALALIAFTAVNAFATPIPLGGGGVVNLSDNGTLLAVTTSGSGGCIAFSGVTSPCTGTTADIVTSTDPFFGTSGTIKDISSTPLVGFKTVNLSGGGGPAIWDLLNIITPSGYGACTLTTTSGSCSTGTFVFTTNSASQVTVSLALNEIGYLGSSSSGSTPYQGIFTTQLSGMISGCTTGAATCTVNIGNILAWELGGNAIKSTWSGTESPVSGVPEPMTLSMMGIGLLGLGLMSRRRKQS